MARCRHGQAGLPQKFKYLGIFLCYAEVGSCFVPTSPTSALKVMIQHPDSSNPPPWLKRPLARVIWMCSTSFSNSSLGPLAWSFTSVPFQSMECIYIKKTLKKALLVILKMRIVQMDAGVGVVTNSW